MGAFFISVNTKMAVIRKKILTRNWMKPIETACFCFCTASSFYWISYVFKDSCMPIDTKNSDD